MAIRSRGPATSSLSIGPAILEYKADPPGMRRSRRRRKPGLRSPSFAPRRGYCLIGYYTMMRPRMFSDPERGASNCRWRTTSMKRGRSPDTASRWGRTRIRHDAASRRSSQRWSGSHAWHADRTNNTEIAMLIASTPLLIVTDARTARGNRDVVAVVFLDRLAMSSEDTAPAPLIARLRTRKPPAADPCGCE
jgi:hypothetical protein